jgi:hypothetical protein
LPVESIGPSILLSLPISGEEIGDLETAGAIKQSP